MHFFFVDRGGFRFSVSAERNPPSTSSGGSFSRRGRHAVVEQQRSRSIPPFAFFVRGCMIKQERKTGRKARHTRRKDIVAVMHVLFMSFKN